MADEAALIRIIHVHVDYSKDCKTRLAAGEPYKIVSTSARGHQKRDKRTPDKTLGTGFSDRLPLSCPPMEDEAKLSLDSSAE